MGFPSASNTRPGGNALQNLRGHGNGFNSITSGLGEGFAFGAASALGADDVGALAHQPLDPAVGNFNFVQSINFKDNVVPAQVAAADEETSGDTPEPNDAPRKAARAQAAEPDIRPGADDHRIAQRAQPASQERKRNFFDFFHRKPKETQQPNQQPEGPNRTGEKKKRFLLF